MPFETLAATVVSSFLVPYAKKGLKKIGKELSGVLSKAGGDAVEAATDAATGTVEKVWEKVKSLFSSGDDKVILDTFEKRPDAGAPMVQAVLEEKLAEDEEAASELKQLVESDIPGAGGVSLNNIMADVFGYVDARGAHVHGNVIGAHVGGMLGNPPVNTGGQEDE